jgi:hypothetical protein
VKEFMGNSVNISLIEMESGDYRANAELVVIVSEPTYTVSPAGEMIRQREMGHFRFALTSRAMRSFIKNLTEYADEMDKTEKRFKVEKDIADEAPSQVPSEQLGGGQ